MADLTPTSEVLNVTLTVTVAIDGQAVDLTRRAIGHALEVVVDEVLVGRTMVVGVSSLDTDQPAHDLEATVLDVRGERP